MSLFSAELVHNLSKEESKIKFRAMLFIVAAQIYHPFKRYYERIYGLREEQEGKLLTSPTHWSSVATKDPIKQSHKPVARRKPRVVHELWQQHRYQLQSEMEKCREFNAFELAPDADQWEWRGIPEKWRFMQVYDFLSTAWMVYASLRVSLGKHLSYVAEWLLGGWTGLSGHCILPGRLVMHPAVDRMFSLLCSLYLLSWRSWQRFSGRANMMSMIMFLLQSEQDLNKFYKLMETTRRPANSAGEHLEYPSFQLPTEAYLQSDLGRAWNQPNEAGVHEHFLRHIMCYEVQQGPRTFYKLRPNRTREARQRLANSLIEATIASLIIFALIALPIAPPVILISMSDFRYAQIYTNCSGELDTLFAQNKLHFWSFTMHGHRLYALVIDLVENVILWSDVAVTLIAASVLTYLMHADIMSYWRHFHARLEALVERSKLEQRLDKLNPSQLLVGGNATDQYGRAFATVSEEELNDLQYEILDFFNQVKQADQFVGDVITIFNLTWLSASAWLIYSFLGQHGIDYPFIVKCDQLFLLLIITIGTNHLGNLHRCCMKSYRLVSSLLAQPPHGHKTQLQFVKVSNFFTERDRTTYTLFHQYPYMTTTYFTTLGWSMSWFFVAYSLFRHGREIALDEHKYF